MNNKIILLFVLLINGFLFYSFTLGWVNQTNDPWEVPEKYQNLKNPIKADKEALSRVSSKLRN